MSSAGFALQTTILSVVRETRLTKEGANIIRQGWHDYKGITMAMIRWSMVDG
jgi:hypothetical protein